MGEEADLSIERMLNDGYLQPPPESYFPWDTQMDSRLRHNARRSQHTPHAPGCRCPGCVHERAQRVEAEWRTKQNADKPLSIEQAFKKAVPYDVPSHIICKRCQATGLHWGLKDGKPEMREEGGWPHKCKKIEGVTLNLPNVLDPQ